MALILTVDLNGRGNAAYDPDARTAKLMPKQKRPDGTMYATGGNAWIPECGAGDGVVFEPWKLVTANLRGVRLTAKQERRILEHAASRGVPCRQFDWADGALRIEYLQRNPDQEFKADPVTDREAFTTELAKRIVESMVSDRPGRETNRNMEMATAPARTLATPATMEQQRAAGATDAQRREAASQEFDAATAAVAAGKPVEPPADAPPGLSMTPAAIKAREYRASQKAASEGAGA